MLRLRLLGLPGPTLRIGAMLALVLTAGSARGLTIASVSFEELAVVNLDPAEPPRLQLVGVPAGTVPPFQNDEILFDVDLTSANPGDVFSVDVSSPAFGAFADRLTNGADDFLFWRVPGESLIVATSESFVLADALGPGEVDFAGFVIERIELRIDGIVIEDNPPPPPPLVFPTDSVQTTGTLTLIGAPIPEPSTAALLALGLVGLVAVHPRRR